MQNLNIKLIRRDGGTQSRVAISDEVVTDYLNVLNQKIDLPPVVVFHDGENHWLADGFHRLAAYEADARASIPADVRKGTQRDAVAYSLSANASHGLRRSNEDKKNSVMRALADPEWGKLGDREIAKLCAVSHTTVANYRKPPPPPAPKEAPKKPAEPKGAGTPTGTAPPPAAPAPAPAEPAGKVATPAAPPAEPEPDDDGGVDEIVTELQGQVATLQARLTAALADDARAEAAKQQHIAAIAQQRQNELMQRLQERDEAIAQHLRTLRRIGKAVGEDDLSKIASKVEELAQALLS